MCEHVHSYKIVYQKHENGNGKKQWINPLDARFCEDCNSFFHQRKIEVLKN